MHRGLAGVAPLHLAHQLGKCAQRIHAVKLEVRWHRLALALLRRTEFLDLWQAVSIADQSAPPPAAPNPIPEELRWLGTFVLPDAAHRVGLAPAIEQAHQPRGVVVEINVVVPRAEAEECVQLHHLDAGGVGVVGNLNLRDLRGRCGSRERQ
jgi:hypothetical protein